MDERFFINQSRGVGKGFTTLRWLAVRLKPSTNDNHMTLERYIRLFAGTFVLASLLLAHFHSQNWLWFTTFVGFNLLQSSLTCFCPLEIVLKKLGVGKSKESCCS